MDKADFLKECMTGFEGVPMDAFNARFCLMCSNRECSRSWGNKSLFDYRAKNWKSMLFDNVPRIADGKPMPKFEPVVPSTSISSNSVPSKFETLSYDDVPDTEPNMEPDKTTRTEPAPALDKTTRTEPAPAPAPQEARFNTPFDAPVMLGVPDRVETKTEEALPGNVFIFDDD